MIAVHKPPGLTPLELLHALRRERADLRDIKLGYAGRLDPMAEGVLLVLVGDENQDPVPYRALEKSYVVDVLLGVSTDTYDALGLVTAVSEGALVPGDDASLRLALSRFTGQIEQAYPAFSSARVRGKRMYHWARRGPVSDLERPRATRVIHRIELRARDTVPANALLESITTRVGMVRGDFRQAAIVERWRDVLTPEPARRLEVVRIEVECSSGTYMRTLADDLGAGLGMGAIALRIVRTRVGDHVIETAMRLDDARSPDV